MLSRSLVARRLFAAALVLFPLSGLALTPPDRITRVDRGATGTLAQNVSGRVKQASDLGEAAAARRLEGVSLNFSRTTAQQADLDQLLLAQQTPGSPQYHHWLTPAQFGARFGLSSADLAKVTSWLTAQGLTVTYTAPSNNLVTVSGTVAQLEQAFSTSIHAVSWKGEQHIANTTDPVLPAAIANVVTSITGLNDFRLQARARLQQISAEAAKPSFTSGTTQAHFLTPGDFQVIYNAKPLLASAINGSNATIAVLGQTDISTADVAAFRAASGLPATAVLAATAAAPSAGPSLRIILGGTADPGLGRTGDVGEAHLDVEWAGAVAPNVNVIYVNSTNVLTSLTYAITNSVAPVLSISYGRCEPFFDGASLYGYNSFLQQANAQGQTLIAAAGDAGATDCDNDSITAADGLAVDFPASSPNATAVGGTLFNDTAANWSSNGSSDELVSALGYIPETIWNETALVGALAAGGGGASVYFPKPTWQVGAGVPADLSRDLPDIALNAASRHDGYLICVSGSCTNGFRNASGILAVVGGTSAGVPSFAGILALVEQQIGSTAGLGNINPILYALGGTSAFHDVTSGTNSSPCVAGSPNCTGSNSIGFSAAPGYDLASGWGSVDASALAHAWLSTTPAGGSTGTGAQIAVSNLSLPASAVSCGISASSITVSAQVAARIAAAGIPTGSVQLLVDGVAVGAPVPLSGGSATLSTSTNGLSSGAHNIAVLYSGDIVFAASKGYLAASLVPAAAPIAPPSIIDVVSSATPDFSLTPCLPSVSVRTGASSTPLSLSATSFNGFSGSVTLTASTDGSLAAGFGFSAPSVTVSTASPGTATLTIQAFTPRSTTTTAAIHNSAWRIGAGTAAMASILFLVLPRRRRMTGLLVALLSAGAIGVLGCGSGATTINPGTATPTVNATAPGSYLVNVTARGANSAGQALSHTTTLTVTVTN